MRNKNKCDTIFWVPLLPQILPQYQELAQGGKDNATVSLQTFFFYSPGLFSRYFFLFSVFCILSFAFGNLYFWFRVFFSWSSTTSSFRYVLHWEYLSSFTFMFHSNSTFCASRYSLLICFVPDMFQFSFPQVMTRGCTALCWQIAAISATRDQCHNRQTAPTGPGTGRVL